MGGKQQHRYIARCGVETLICDLIQENYIVDRLGCPRFSSLSAGESTQFQKRPLFSSTAASTLAFCRPKMSWHFKRILSRSCSSWRWKNKCTGKSKLPLKKIWSCRIPFFAWLRLLDETALSSATGVPWIARRIYQSRFLV